MSLSGRHCRPNLQDCFLLVLQPACIELKFRMIRLVWYTALCTLGTFHPVIVHLTMLCLGLLDNIFLTALHDTQL